MDGTWKRKIVMVLVLALFPASLPVWAEETTRTGNRVFFRGGFAAEQRSRRRAVRR